MWVLFNFVSTMVTIVGIYKILKYLEQLKRYNPGLKTNYFQLTLHAVILSLNLIAVIVDCLPNAWFTSSQVQRYCHGIRRPHSVEIYS